ncbi:CbrC family protein [Citrobacter telavivensis]
MKIFTWQDQSGATHCHDACDFAGDATVHDLKNAGEAAISLWMQRYDMTRNDWQRSPGQ